MTTAVPRELRRIVDRAKGTIQPKYGWRRGQWVKAAPAVVKFLLADPEVVPETLDRSDLVRLCGDINDEPTALLAYLATMAWGSDTRDGRVAPRTGAGLQATGAIDSLMATVETARGGEPKRAYRLARTHRIKGVGPAFATKFLSFCSRAQYPNGPDQHVALIHDSVLSSWLWEEAAVDVSAGDWAPRSYDRYLETMWSWADTEGIPADRLEELIFRSWVTGGDLNERDGWPRAQLWAYRAVRRAWAALVAAGAPAEEVDHLDALSRRMDGRW